ncbi:MAG: diguanylate cyclase [Gammaproteobacteria bacterium]|nr:diguanylate cyclase [Gammaproteobacteria bacterium]
MNFELCDSRGFDVDAIAERLHLLGLDGPESRQYGYALQDLVVRPNVDAIIDGFYASLVENETFSSIVSKHSSAERLKDAQQRYLLRLGVDFDQHQYFEERLRVGSIHHKIGVPQSVYQCSFQWLQCLLIQYIPPQLRSDHAAFENMLQFILKITTLDTSLAVESYCADRVFGIEESLKSVRGEKEWLHYLSVTDQLTGFHNHSYCRRFLIEALDRARAENSPLCVIMADVDHFKNINDTYGHLVGDEVLRIIAARMVSGARAGDEIGRYGGEEFLFILQDTEIDEGRDVAERVRARVNNDAVHSRDVEIWVSLSLGIAQAREKDDADSLIERADQALYAAKLAGRNRVCTKKRA